eukprot:CAMPEP_0115583616 /NCGR_PEP_ID=MMETSP0272-20121206/6265_1 /TAXON_ID=71861 /ORGANISM="Scrippsiella trochoidea, Strain CCMP3099" /LENGTH=164 /DNA_ID=CAMNT_0003018635 /DNA_START=79 /DNA_END=570 /DNA_ORIENTATION=+
MQIKRRPEAAAATSCATVMTPSLSSPEESSDARWTPGRRPQDSGGVSQSPLSVSTAMLAIVVSVTSSFSLYMMTSNKSDPSPKTLCLAWSYALLHKLLWRNSWSAECTLGCKSMQTSFGTDSKSNGKWAPTATGVLWTRMPSDSLSSNELVVEPLPLQSETNTR